MKYNSGLQPEIFLQSLPRVAEAFSLLTLGFYNPGLRPDETTKLTRKKIFSLTPMRFRDSLLLLFLTPHSTHGLTAISFRAGLPNIVAAATKKDVASLWRKPQYWGAPHEAEEPKVLQRSVGLMR